MECSRQRRGQSVFQAREATEQRHGCMKDMGCEWLELRVCGWNGEIYSWRRSFNLMQEQREIRRVF